MKAKDNKGNKYNSFHLNLENNERILILGHYPFLGPHISPRTSLSELKSCSLLETFEVHGKKLLTVFRAKWKKRITYTTAKVQQTLLFHHRSRNSLLQ